MNRAELARRLAPADEASRRGLLSAHPELADAELGWALKDAYEELERSDPAAAAPVSDALAALAATAPSPELTALSNWIAGRVALDAGRLEDALRLLDGAAAGFGALGRPELAASVRVTTVIVLAILGRYDEAIRCGEEARAVFLAAGDELSAGKIEVNLGNLYHRRGEYGEAEVRLRSARERLRALGEAERHARADNSLAMVLSSQYRLDEASALLQQALVHADAAGKELTVAEIECNLGCLELDRGHYSSALDLLERSRRRYDVLDLPHESALADHELADAYLELNLAPEAAAIYERVTPVYATLGMRAEEARARLNHGRALTLLGRLEDASDALRTARQLYIEEGNAVGAAIGSLFEAHVRFTTGDLAGAEALAAAAEPSLVDAGAWGRILLVRWLRAEIARLLGRRGEARTQLEAVFHDAERLTLPQIAPMCLTSLGQLLLADGDIPGAEDRLRMAVERIESLRSTLPAEDFRTAFVSDKLTPYTELIRLCLDDTNRDRTVEALGYVERSKSRALVEMFGSSRLDRRAMRTPAEARLVADLERLRGELNWLYTRINRPPDEDGQRSATLSAELHADVRVREDAVLDLSRRLSQTSVAFPGRQESPDVAELYDELDHHTALVEYFSVDGELVAFLVTGDGVEVVRHLGDERDVADEIAQLWFQLDTMRYGTALVRTRLPQLEARLRRRLERLYETLLGLIEERIGDRRLLVAPYRGLHYVPFHALHDGVGYVLERREVGYVPSASMLQRCLGVPRRALQRATLVGVPDERTPRVRDEVLALAPLFPEAVTLLGEGATVAALRAATPGADVLHLACHGQFRQDNPLFSALRLQNEWLTVHDAAAFELDTELVTLSACETGLSSVAPGDELIGLTRGFFFAGAPSLVVSLWAVDDEATSTLMQRFYSGLLGGANAAGALRAAQLAAMRENPHPYYWSPFILLGRW